MVVKTALAARSSTCGLGTPFPAFRAKERGGCEDVGQRMGDEAIGVCHLHLLAIGAHRGG
jgi:hypothetical protein